MILLKAQKAFYLSALTIYSAAIGTLETLTLLLKWGGPTLSAFENCRKHQHTFKNNV